MSVSTTSIPLFSYTRLHNLGFSDNLDHVYILAKRQLLNIENYVNSSTVIDDAVCKRELAALNDYILECEKSKTEYYQSGFKGRISKIATLIISRLTFSRTPMERLEHIHKYLDLRLIKLSKSFEMISKSDFAKYLKKADSIDTNQQVQIYQFADLPEVAFIVDDNKEVNLVFPNIVPIAKGSLKEFHIVINLTKQKKRGFSRRIRQDAHSVAQMEREICFSRLFMEKHIPIPKLKAAIGNQLIITQYCNQGNLMDYLQNNPDLPLKTKIDIACQIVNFVAELHKEFINKHGNKDSIIHCDIKLENVLMKKRKNGELRAMVNDFDLSIYESEAKLHYFRGSPACFSPDVAAKKPPTKADDVWSCGLLLFNLFCPDIRLPWDIDCENIHEIFEGIRALEKDWCIKYLEKHQLPPALITVINYMLNPAASERPNINSAAKALADLK